MEAVTTYRNNPVTLSDSDSNDDSDSDGDWKRNRHNARVFEDSSCAVPSLSPPTPIIKCASDVPNNSKKRRVNNVWSSVLQEQTVSDVFTQCQLKPKLISMVDRSCESYDFHRKELDDREDIFPDEADMDTHCEEDIVEKQEANMHFKKKNKFRLRPEDLQVAKKIIYKLNEKKRYLIYRIVHVVGAEKAMELLRMTEDVEENGGMLIKNNSRRRTPGGVYIQLLKSDKHLTKVQIDEIFADEEPFFFRKGDKKNKNRKKNKRGNYKQASLDAGDNNEAPPSPPITDVKSPVSKLDVPTTINAETIETEDFEIEDGEILDD